MKTKDIYKLYKQSYKVTIDTRKVTENCLYFAFKGANFDGNTLAEKAIHEGALASFVDNKEYANPSMNIFHVKSTEKKLQKLAKMHRKHLEIPIIGLTGSNGKTTTKELMAAVLNRKYKTLYTEGNLNNHLGVPLTILRINPSYEMAIIEMGANHQGEIRDLCKIAQPDIGYITNFGKAHLEGFGGEKGVIKGKSELYKYLHKHDKSALINEKDPIQVKKSKKIKSKITFGKKTSDYDYHLNTSKDGYLNFSYENDNVQTQLTGDYNFSNACAAFSLGLHFNVPKNEIESALENYTPENQRSQVIEKDGKTIILDAYNANPSSMKAALENFQKFETPKAVILGDMFELGEYAKDEHQNIINEINLLKPNEVLLVGENFYNLRFDKFHFFPTKKELEDYLKKEKIKSKNILIKASRGIALETIIDLI